MRELRFGLVWNGVDPPTEVARRAEAAGYATLLFPDHTGMLAPFPAMAAAAAVTSEIRLGTQVVNVAFRPLGALVQELAAIDIISAGRLEAGIGAGASGAEVRSLGLPFPGPADRVGAVERALTELPRLFGGEALSETGFQLSPLPPQGGAVPLMVGGHGRKLLAVGARLAGIVQFVGFTGSDFTGFSEDGLKRRIAHVREHAGDRFADFELSVLLQRAGVVADPAAAVEDLRSVRSGAITAGSALRSPFVQVGSDVGAVCEQILDLRERHGVSYFTVFDGRAPGFDAVVGRLATC